MRALPARVTSIDAGTGFRVAAPHPLVPAEHFAGTRLEANLFAFYGELHSLGPSIDWEVNPGNPHWGHDLNRFGFLVLYDVEPEQASAHRMLALIVDWLDKNGDCPRHGSPYAWQNLLNIAIRVENWWRFIAGAVRRGHCVSDSAVVQRIALATIRQTMTLLRLIRKRGFRDNWSIIGLRAAFYILYAIAPFPQRARLIAIAHGYLHAAVSEQVLPDGAQQELSPHYHWVALELVSSIRALADEAGDRTAAWLDPTIGAMKRVLGALMSPSGAIVALGDSDAEYGSRIGAFLERKPDTAHLPNAEPEIEVFPYAGLASVRHRSTESLLVFDGGPYGTGHQHEDALGFWLCGYGEDLIVDPGRYLYEKGADTFYAHLRSTAAHSTIRIDGQDQNAAATPTRWRRSSPGSPDIEHGNEAVTLSAVFSEGYGPELIPVRHQRDITVTQGGLVLHVRDLLSGEGVHEVEQIWLVSPGAWELDGRVFRATRGKARIEIASLSEQGLRCRVAEGERNPFRGWYSPRLNVITPTAAFIVKGQLTLPAVIETLIHVDAVS